METFGQCKSERLLIRFVPKPTPIRKYNSNLLQLGKLIVLQGGYFDHVKVHEKFSRRIIDVA